MQPKLATLTALAIATALAVATPTRRAGTTSGDCTTGPVQCCDSSATAGSSAAAELLRLLGIQVQDTDVLVGLTCSPITVIGAGKGTCPAEPFCCSDNSHGGLIAIGCTPVAL
ncbi:hydrophobin 2 [Mycena vulgaris]|nr:hydrophobin 2 [Mycena vulgaris]